MIEPLLKELEPLVVSELNRANLVNPQFHSSHEGVAVIEEEVEEVKESMELMTHLFSVMKNRVFHDDLKGAEDAAERIRRYAKYAAAELIQVAAMCDKYMFMRGGGEDGKDRKKTCPEK